MNDYLDEALKQLADQVRFAPPARRQEQIARAEKLLGEIDANRRYPYSWVCYRLTDFRPTTHSELVFSGETLKHDLGVFIRKVGRTIPALPVEQLPEPVLTLEEISKKFNVSTKTISRWRVRGLVGQRIIRNGRRQLGFPQSVVESFLQNHHDRVQRSARFSHLTDAEKESILRRARRLSQAGGSLTEVSRRIAKRLGRSVEAVRYTIKHFDQQNPQQALFPALAGPLDGSAKESIYHSYRRGIPVNELAKQYGRTRTSMYRVINEVCAERLIQQPLDYIYHESFDDPAQEAVITAPMPDLDKFESQRRGMKAPKDVPAELAHLYETPLLSRDQEQHQFRLMNFLKHKLHKLRSSLNPAEVRVQDLQQLEELHSQIEAVKERLIKSNMRLVVSYAKRHSNGENLFELVSDGNISLMRAVDKFDYSRGNKFSTYASWAILKNYARSIPDEKNYRERYLTGHEDVFEGRADWRSDESEVVAQAEQARDRINQLLSQLDPRTRDVIRMRAGLNGSEQMTLEQIGLHFGITKERVRQINVRGMKQLREKALAQKVDLP
ncbi:sigma-70 family RNA polymerase sigma factor [Tuwongella immobilis]|uniref:RNA polymerase sigma-70 domain-containing protein n=1 Tax=Tuwongella immobilis TaxID=692036 RepID=A0A6C2YNX4_9BACT|nr:sigma-70 family RNA polymerase sigma factor [Tuwongella immobilis]VIP02755.1 sigma-70 factor : RNA polymerase sigma factor, sigma-70 family OS=Singulisphaera acidiphila (strain ATCC BAA-1392 / DSM 18658 / VKM B-2454 / MOB10) GN=Sinac_0515 PE=4 SV=1: Sigma70_r2: Sigma70_r4 [Tuwongella immobilis]VTS02354.1 sigma-70 factor : RNA polymerase sigma factor, sigma-70 family OS=Singulisphaera acidiphila (strain ATCC BAA-1392 / DSM 18658 / VKM B-2454 / MOB10) GN=Sinac_0515 PE=4 SV=1: Sigma70_r2: Sigma70